MTQPASTVISARTDIKILATIASFYDKKERSPRHNNSFGKSSLLNQILTDLHTMLVTNNMITPIDTIEEAASKMTELGYDLQSNKKGEQTLLNALSKESIQSFGETAEEKDVKVQDALSLLEQDKE